MVAQKAAGLMAPPGRPPKEKIGSGLNPICAEPAFIEGIDPAPIDPRPITLAEAGIDKHLADRTRKAAGSSHRRARAAVLNPRRLSGLSILRFLLLQFLRAQGFERMIVD